MRRHSTSPTAEEILQAIRDGVYEAFSERLDYSRFPMSFDNIGFYLAKGITDAFLDNAPDDKPDRSKNQRKTISRLIRMAVWEKTDGHCVYCGERMNPFARFHVDHVNPIALGGDDEIENLVPACQRCNNEKHALPLEVFRQRRGGGLFWFEREENGGAS